MDRGTILADIGDVQATLDMQDAAGEILGFFPDAVYRRDVADSLTDRLGARWKNADEFAPTVVAMHRQPGIGELMDYMGLVTTGIVGSGVTSAVATTPSISARAPASTLTRQPISTSGQVARSRTNLRWHERAGPEQDQRDSAERCTGRARSRGALRRAPGGVPAGDRGSVTVHRQ